MPCESLEELISASIDRETGVEEEAFLRAHLSSCVPCRAKEEELRGLKAAVSRMALPPIPQDLKRTLLEAAAEADRRPARPWSLSRWLPRPSRMAYGFAAAGLLLAVAAADLFFSPPTETVPIDLLLEAHGRYAASVKAPVPQEDRDESL